MTHNTRLQIETEDLSWHEVPRAQFEATIAKLAAEDSVAALAGIFDAIMHAIHGFQAFSNQPRIGGDAEKVLDGIMTSLFDKAAMIVRDLLHMPAVRTIDRDLRARVLVDWAFEMG